MASGDDGRTRQAEMMRQTAEAVGDMAEDAGEAVKDATEAVAGRFQRFRAFIRRNRLLNTTWRIGVFTVGVTGTNGKTSIAVWLGQALARVGTPTAVIGTLGVGMFLGRAEPTYDVTGYTTPDAVLLAEVYAAGEAPIVAADGRSLARAVRVAGKVEPVFVDDITEMPDAIQEMARDGDVVICMGAGSIGGVPAKLVETGGGV